MFVTLKKNGIELPDSFFTVGKDFKPKFSGSRANTTATAIASGAIGPRRASGSEMAEREGFEPSIRLLTRYSLSRGAPSASRAPLRF